jgi:hypothetical protein
LPIATPNQVNVAKALWRAINRSRKRDKKALQSHSDVLTGDMREWLLSCRKKVLLGVC